MKRYQSPKVFAASAATSLLLLSVAQPASAVTVSQQPLFLTEGVSPNLLVTLDDSGSMAWAYAPDSISGDATTNQNNASQKRYFSATYNPMYYNPTVTYKPPKIIQYNSTTGLTEVTAYSTSYTKAWIHGFKTNLGSVNLSNNFVATKTYTSGSTSQSFASHPFKVGSNYGGGTSAYYYLFDTTLSNCDSTINDNDCYKKVNVTAAEQQNFANWYSFYRTRALATQSAANLAFYSLPEDVRVTWQMLNTCKNIGAANSGSCSGQSGTTYSNGLKVFSKHHRDTFFNWLSDTPTSGGTPLRTALERAGDYLKRDNLGSKGAYAQDPGVSTGTLYACRPSYHILMTDGLWNSDTVSVGNYDNDNHTLPDAVSYTARAPYKDAYSNTLADLAFKYWAEDLQPNIANELSPYTPYDGTDKYWDPRNDPATWQHMTTFTLGLGLTRQLTNPLWGGSTFSGDYAALKAGTKDWPQASDNNSNNVYDLWHAALNSRGEFFSVDSPDAMVDAFDTILSRIADRETSAAAVSLESAISRSGNEAYYARFGSNPWYGDLIRYDVDSNGALALQWNARDLLALKDWNTRNIQMNRNGSLASFTWANLSTAQQTLLNKDRTGVIDNLGSARVDFVRGNQSQAGNAFYDRKQSNILGDIVHSSPVVVSAPDRLEQLMNPLHNPNGEPGTYSSFKRAQKDRDKRIYVGANDGMLHAFDETGQETFAYVPTAIIPKLNKLADKAYGGTNHEFFVDGTPVVGDVVINGQWRTILVGTLRGGGQAIFVLDITNPNAPSLLWEYSSANDQDFGFSFGRPVITRLHSGDWGIVMSNGYSSTNETAALFIFNAANGSVLKKLSVNSGSAAPNGLSSPRVVDIDGDLITDYVYAGDLQGNMWRFDLFKADVTPPFAPASNVAASLFRVAFGGSPLYQAKASNGTAQPITAAPALIRHPSGTGFIVSFGTGKYLESVDAQADTTKAMTLYGIWDTQTDGKSASSPQIGSPLSRNNLVQQTYESSSTATFSDDTSSRKREFRVLSSNPVPYGDPKNVNKHGWYLDLTNGSTLEGELIATDLTSRVDLLLGTSTIPSQNPCQSGIDRWFFAIDGVTGGATSFNVIDTTGNNVVDANDSNYGRVVSGVKIPGFGSPAVVGQDAFFNTDGGVQRERLDFGDLSRGRQNWRTVEE